MAILNKANLVSNITNKQGQKIEVSTNSNIARTSQVDTEIVVVKSTEQSWVIPNGKLEIKTIITNNTDIEIVDPKLKEILSEDATFIKGTVKIGSQSYPTFDPVVGMTLPVNIGAFGGEVEITYQVQVNEYPQKDLFTSQSTLTVLLLGKQFVINSNSLSIDILSNGVSLLKQVNTTVAKKGDVLVYTITISNDGAFANTDLFFTDPIPDGAEFVENSVKVNGTLKTDYNPSVGFTLDDLGVNETQTVEFSVRIT